jgi:hypothetical protein
MIALQRSGVACILDPELGGGAADGLVISC